MSAGVLERPGRTSNGGGPARRAVIRWAVRLLRREWRQQLLVLALITVTVGATFVASAVATTAPSPATAGFGTAQYLATFTGSGSRIATEIASLRQRFGPIDVIETQPRSVPGSIQTYSLRAQNPHGRFGQPMLGLVSGHYPAGPGQVAVTSGVAADFHLAIGSSWSVGGVSRKVTGIVRNPQNLLDEFALVTSGQLSGPAQVAVLFDAPRSARPPTGVTVTNRQAAAASGNVINPETISLAAATLGMLLIALVAAGGFTVLAQRRLRSIGMMAAQGATEANIRLVVRANGAATGVAGAVTGFVLGMLAWLAYRPQAQASAHHVIGVFQLPWRVIGVSMALAVVAAYLAAARPARAIARVPIVVALSGRPAPPKPVRHLAVPFGLAFAVLAFVLLGMAGSGVGAPGGASPANQSTPLREVVYGLIALAVAVVLLSPTCLALLARLGRRMPVAVRLAVRDLARYRARSGPALAAISLSVLIAAGVIVVTAARFSNVLDYAGPNLTSSQLIVYPGGGPGSGPGGGPGSGPGGAGPIGNPPAGKQDAPPAATAPPAPTAPTATQLTAAGTTARRIAADLGARSVITLKTAGDLRYAARPELERADLRRDPPALAGIRDHADTGQSRRRLPDHATGPVRDAASAVHLGRERQGRPAAPGRTGHHVPLPAERLPAQPAHPGNERAAVRHLGAEHGDHRACRAGIQPQAGHSWLADPGAWRADPQPDHGRQADRGGGRADDRDRQQHPVTDAGH